jgi:thioredoxin reductase (NADPH)
MDNPELVIIGAGAAGLAAGLYAVRSGLIALVLEEKLAGGTTLDAPLVENYLGFTKIVGSDLVENFAAHANEAGVKINEFESVVSLDLKGDKKIVKTNKATYEANALVIASGSHYRQIGASGENEFRGRGVSYCGICDGPLFRGKKVAVVGGGNSALITALYLADLASEVKVVHRRDTFRAENALVDGLRQKKNIEVLFNIEVKEIKGDKLVNRVVAINARSGESREIPVDGVFVQVGEFPNSQIAKEAGVEVDADGYIKIDIRQQTNIPGVFAAGDVTNHPVKQVGVAAGQGATAAIEAYGYIRRPYYRI